MFGLGHLDIGPLVFGAMLFISMTIWYLKWAFESYGSLFLSVFIFFFILYTHTGGGKAYSAGIAASTASLLFDLLGPFVYRIAKWLRPKH